MQATRVVSAALLALGLGACSAWSQTLSEAHGPAEAPPAGYSGRQYVDSTGCVYIRAGVSGAVTWVPRVTQDRKQVCGYEPTSGGTVVVATGGAAPAAVALKTTARPAATVPAVTTADATPAVATTARRGKRMLVDVSTVAGEITRCPDQEPSAQRYLLSDGVRATRCGNAVADPVGYLNGLATTALDVGGEDRSPAAVAKARTAGARGHRVVWSNAKLRETDDAAESGGAATAPGTVAATTGYYVQVGAFALDSNATGAIARLRDLGLPVARSGAHLGGKALQVVLAGPFETDAAARNALAQARRVGFADAFVRG